MLVPPELDCPRVLKVKKATPKSNNTFCLEFDEKADESLKFEGKSLLIKKKDFCDVFGELSSAENDLVGKQVEDKNLGPIGKIEDMSGTQTQKHLVVDYDGREVMIPYVDEIVISVEDNVVKTNLPEGILELNEA